MLDLQEIENTIDKLERGPTTFDSCQKLASLYIVRDEYKKTGPTQVDAGPDVVEQELDDILPQYRQYCQIKTRYQRGEIASDAVLRGLSAVNREIREFIHTLYRSTDFPEERNLILQMIDELHQSYQESAV